MMNDTNHLKSDSKGKIITLSPEGKMQGSVELEIDRGELNASAHHLPEKRGARQRKPVVLMQNQYKEIYATHHSRKKSKQLEVVTGENNQASAQGSSQADDEQADDDEGNANEGHSRSSSRLAAKVDKKRKHDSFLFPDNRKKTRRSAGPAEISVNEAEATSSQLKGSRRRDNEASDEENMKKRSKKTSTDVVVRETPENSVDLFSEDLKHQGSAFMTRNNSNLKNDNNEGSLDMNESYSSFGENDDLTEEFPRNLRRYAKAPITEGSATEGQIRVGPMHQASVPTLCARTNYVSSRPQGAVKVWQGGLIQEAELTSFLESATSLVTCYLKKNGFHTSPTNNLLKVLIGPRNKEDTSPEQKTEEMPKELNIDAILALLHEKSYDCTAALNVIDKSPATFVDLWSKRDRDTYDTGFSKFFSNLRSISKGFDDSKTFKDVVDYHYRHKIPEQFRRYQESKLLQARRMLQAVENRRMQDISNDTREAASSTNASVSRVDNGNGASTTAAHAKKYRHW